MWVSRAPLWSSGLHIGQRRGRSAVQIYLKASFFRGDITHMTRNEEGQLSTFKRGDITHMTRSVCGDITHMKRSTEVEDGFEA